MNRQRLQFSVRGLLLFTALVAVVLVVAVQMPVLFALCFYVAAILLALRALVWSVEIATSERRPRLAIISWVLFGCFFSGLGALVWSVQHSSDAAAIESSELAFYVLMGVCTLVCLARAGYVFRGMRRQATTANGA